MPRNFMLVLTIAARFAQGRGLRAFAADGTSLGSPAAGWLLVLGLVGSCGGSANVLAGDSSGSGLSIESRSVVFSYPETDPYSRTNLYGFNHAPSVARLPDGRLLCVWFSGPFEASVHQVLLAAFSDDGGRTWRQAFVLQDEPRQSDFDPALIVDGQRTWLFYIAGRWDRYPFVKDERQHVGPDSYILYARHSDDSGRNWSRPRSLLPGERQGCRSNGTRLTSGELVLPLHTIGAVSPASLLRSEDQGRNFQRVGQVETPAGSQEPTLAELQDGTLLMAFRTGDSHLWTARSMDKGETWSPPVRHEMQAGRASHNLFRLQDGRVLLTHDECASGLRTPLTMRLTRDGRHWHQPLTLANCPQPGQHKNYWQSQVTYPSVCQLPDGMLVVVWAEIHISDTEQIGIIQSARVSAASVEE